LTVGSDELSYEKYLADTYRPAFDGMRAIGFLLVITAHIPSVPFFGYLQGWTGVWLFLVISGYLVTMLMLREETSQGHVAFGAFLTKRFFRIVPSYWLAILIYLAACLALPPLAADYEDIMARLPYLFGLMPEYANTDGYTILTHMWAVGVEVKFYLLFPPIVFLTSSGGFPHLDPLDQGSEDKHAFAPAATQTTAPLRPPRRAPRR